MNCGKCGAPLAPGVKYCDKCGTEVGAPIAPPPVEPKKGPNKIIIIAVLCAIIVALITTIAIVMVTKDSDSSDDTKTSTKKEKDKPVEPVNPDGPIDPVTPDQPDQPDQPEQAQLPKIDTSNVVFKPESSTDSRANNIQYLGSYYFAEDNAKYADYRVLLKNNNELIDVRLYLNFYKNGQRIGSVSAWASNVKAGSEFVADFSLSAREPYDSFDITVSAEKVDSSYYGDFKIDESKVKVVKAERKIVAMYENTSTETFTAYACIKYMKDGKVVFVDKTISSSVAPGLNAEFTFYNFSIPEDVEYDDYKVVIYSAYYVANKDF